MGLVGCMNVLVWTSNYNIENLQKIASEMRKDLLSNIVQVNAKINVDYGNTIVNFNTPMGSLNELYLFIGVDRSNHQMISDSNRFYKDSYHGKKGSSNPIPYNSTKVSASRNRFTFYPHSPTTCSSTFNSIKSNSVLNNVLVKRFSTTPSIMNNDDYTIMQRLGLDPSFVHIHKKIVKDKVNVIKSWSYGDMEYYFVVDDVNSLTLSDIDKFIISCITEGGAIYAVMPMVLTDSVVPTERFITIGGQIVMTKQVKPMAILNRLQSSLNSLLPEYGLNGKIFGQLIFKWRIISYDVGMHNVIGADISKTSTINRFIKDGNDITFSDIIPLSFDLNKYGDIINKDYIYNNYKIEGVHYQYSDHIIVFIHNSRENNVRNITIFKKGAIYVECLDVLLDDGTLVRTYDNGMKLFIDNKRCELKYFERTIECSSIKKGKIDLIKDFKISAFDIEAYSCKENNCMFIAYACGFIKPNKDVLVYYLTDFDNSRDMLKKCLIDMLESNLGTVYVHNLSKFDTFFIEFILTNDNDIVGKYSYNKDGMVLNIKVSFKDKSKKGSFIFRDSILMMPGSLKSLTLSFKSDMIKLDFPHNFASHETLEYVGVKPDISYYEGMSREKYDLIPLNWNFRDESIKYLKYDLGSLQEIMIKFAKDIYKLEKINITKVPTISSLSFKAITTNYIKPNLLFKIKGTAHNNMRRAFFGGAAEVYNLNAIDEVRIYDINSSYPASMKMPMPVGKPLFSNDKNLDNYFGVVFAKIKTPRDNKGEYININYPPLPYRLSNIRIINPIGNWSDMYCSEILKYVRDVYNYEIEVIYGYKYDRCENIFGDFIDKYYDIKSGVNKDTDINKSTSKLMLNSAFGRTGLKLDESTVELVTAKKSKDLQIKYNVKKIIERSPDLHWVSYERIINPFYLNNSNTPLEKNDISLQRAKENNSTYDADQCLPIAIFTTTYSSIRLFEAIRNIEQSGKKVYAVDTDSIHTNGILSDDLIGSELGKWKLEFIGYKGGYYPLPKLYYVEGYAVKGNTPTDKISELKKGKGVKRGSISKDEYVSLIEGLPIEKNDPRFVIDRNSSTVKFKDVKVEIKPDLIKRKIIREGDEIGTIPHVVLDGILQD